MRGYREVVMQGRSSRLVHPLEEDLNAVTQPPTAWKMQKQRKLGTAGLADASMHMSETERDSEAVSELGMQSD